MTGTATLKKVHKNHVFQEFSRIALVIVGAVMVAFGLEAFLIPNGFLDGGITGISILLSDFIPIPMGVILGLLNVPFVILTYFKLGKRSAVRTVIGVATLAITAILLHHMEPITTNYVLALGYGGLLLGGGIGIALKQGGALDGLEALASIISNRSRFSVEQLILYINITIFIIAAFVKDPLYAMGSALLFYVVVAPIIKRVMEGGEEIKSVRILTDLPEHVAAAITSKAKHNVTSIPRAIYVEGEGFTKNSTELSLIVSRMEEATISDLVREIDDRAILIFSDIAAARGGAYENSSGH